MNKQQPNVAEQSGERKSVNLQLKSTPELASIMEILGETKAFSRFMEILEARCTGLAIWAHSLEDETHRLWAGGRVQEMSDVLKLYHNRHQLVKLHSRAPAEEVDREI